MGKRLGDEARETAVKITKTRIIRSRNSKKKRGRVAKEEKQGEVLWIWILRVLVLLKLFASVTRGKGCFLEQLKIINADA